MIEVEGWVGLSCPEGREGEAAFIFHATRVISLSIAVAFAFAVALPLRCPLPSSLPP